MTVLNNTKIENCLLFYSSIKSMYPNKRKNLYEFTHIG